MCPKNGTIFTLRVPEMGLLFLDFAFLYLVYVYIGNVESTPVGNLWYVVCADIWYI